MVDPLHGSGGARRMPRNSAASSISPLAPMAGLSRRIPNWRRSRPRPRASSWPAPVRAPKDIPDTVAQGCGAAAQAMKLMCQGEVLMDAAYAEIQDEFCCGCKICNDMCPYHAIDFDDEQENQSHQFRAVQGLRHLCGGLSLRRDQGAVTSPMNRSMRRSRGFLS